MKFAHFVCPLVLFVITAVLVQSDPVPVTFGLSFSPKRKYYSDAKHSMLIYTLDIMASQRVLLCQLAGILP
jgi:hypothetical protein